MTEEERLVERTAEQLVRSASRVSPRKKIGLLKTTFAANLRFAEQPRSASQSKRGARRTSLSGAIDAQLRRKSTSAALATDAAAAASSVESLAPQCAERLAGVDKAALADAIMRPNQTREAEIQGDMTRARELCAGALIQVAAQPALLERPAELVSEMRAREAAVSGYPSWTTRTALCGASDEDGDSVWVTHFFPALGDALSAHGNIGLVGVDMRAPGLPMVYASDGFLKLAKRPRSQLVGRNCHLLQTNPKGATRRDSLQANRVASLSAAIRSKREHLVKLCAYDGFGEEFQCVVIVVPIRRDRSAEVAYSLGLQIRLSTPEALGRALFAVDILLRNLPRTTTCVDVADGSRPPGCLHDRAIPLFLAAWLALDDPTGLDDDATPADATPPGDPRSCGAGSKASCRVSRWTALLELLLTSDETRQFVDESIATGCSIAARELVAFAREVERLRLAGSGGRRREALSALLQQRDSAVSRLTPLEPRRDEDLDAAWRLLESWRDATIPYAALVLLPVLLPLVCRRLAPLPATGSRDGAGEDASPGRAVPALSLDRERRQRVGGRDRGG